ncbi:hypothetical protein BANRA_00017 [Klebsiella pneumoniae]|nr:hypothetical protein BANRA_00017 [Klebsiella pneumoniae]
MNKLIPLIVLSCLLPLAANARTITATGDTDHAESKIRQHAAREGVTTIASLKREWATKCISRRKSRTKPPASGSGMSWQPARQVRRSFFPSTIAARRRAIQASVFPGELRHADIAHLPGSLCNTHPFRQHQAAGVDQA